MTLALSCGFSAVRSAFVSFVRHGLPRLPRGDSGKEFDSGRSFEVGFVFFSLVWKYSVARTTEALSGYVVIDASVVGL